MNQSTKHFICSFCNKTRDEVKKLIQGPDKDIFICDECIKLSFNIIQDEESEINEHYVYTPEAIYNHLNEFVIGQEEAKKVLSVAVYNHYKRINHIATDIELDKSNVLLLGPSGSGKTLLASTIAKILDVPFAIADATTVTEAGYVGDDVENLVTKLLSAADYDIERAEKGIVYVDEIDKKGRKSESTSITRDVSGEGVQQALLKMIEGAEIRVPPSGGRKHPQSEIVEINTKDILFILGGAFIDLEKHIKKRLNKTKSIGFGAIIDEKQDDTNYFNFVEPDDLVEYGLIPELVGRIPIRVGLKELTHNELVKVLTEPKNSITKQFQRLFEMDNVKLEFTDGACEEIVKLCTDTKVGARGLRSVIESTLLDVQFNLPNYEKKGIEQVVINEDTIKKRQEPFIVYGKKQQKK
ncbi:MAG: ATP-dependent Clp protease ATP-binding subunit ClpX [Methanobacteriota archaeon]|jgi:ATP-dependent Clp protease ATP-binding subunit ClpX|nr:MAG: ATP-dependent Clp protease ATP-binding subunit ClpX [Euryarchaeota archaeon]